MLKKKILSIVIVLGSCTACITQGNYINFAPNTDTVIGTNTVNCDEYFNCTTIKNGITYNGLQLTNSYSRDMIRFWNTNNTIGKILNTVNWGANQSFGGELNTGTTLKITDYTTSLTFDNGACDYLPTKGGITVENRYETYKGKKITSYNISNVNNGGSCFCFNYNEDLGSVCIQDPGIDRATYGFTSNDYGLNGARYTNENLQVGTSQLEGAGGGDEEEQNVGCINIKTQIMMYGASYNTGLCYTNDKQRSGSLYTGERVTVTPKSIFEIFTGFDSYKTRRNIYENSCHAPYTQEYCLARMNGNQYATEFFTKIDNAINNQGLTTVTAEKVYQYCHLQLNFTEDEKRETTKCQAEEDGTYYATGITAEGGNQNPIEGLTNIILEEGKEIILPDDGTVFDQILPEGIISWKDFAVSKDNLKEALNIAVKFMSIFMFRPQKEGILPEYISSLILIFVFYQIIRRRTGN